MAQVNSKAVNYFAKINYDNNHEVQIPEEGWLDFSPESSYVPNLDFNLVLPDFCVRIFQNEVLNADLDYRPLPSTSLITLINNTNLPLVHKGIYELIRITLLEVWSLKFSVTNTSYQKYMLSSDIDSIRFNLNWIADWLINYRSYRFLAEFFRDLEVSLGYLAGQLKMTLDSTDLSRSLGYYADNLN